MVAQLHAHLVLFPFHHTTYLEVTHARRVIEIGGSGEAAEMNLRKNGNERCFNNGDFKDGKGDGGEGRWLRVLVLGPPYASKRQSRV